MPEELVPAELLGRLAGVCSPADVEAEPSAAASAGVSQATLAPELLLGWWWGKWKVNTSNSTISKSILTEIV